MSKQIVVLVGISAEAFAEEWSRLSPYRYITATHWEDAKASHLGDEPCIMIASVISPPDDTTIPHVQLSRGFSHQLEAGKNGSLGVPLLGACLDDSVSRELRGEGPRRGVILEDQPTLALVYRSVLELFNFEVSVFTERRGDDTLLKGLGPDLLLLDVQMPGLGWMEYVGRVKQASPQTKIFLITGDHTLRNECSVEGVLLKPFGLKELLLPVKRVLEGGD